MSQIEFAPAKGDAGDHLAAPDRTDIDSRANSTVSGLEIDDEQVESQFRAIEKQEGDSKTG
jgi:hypothetical protein